VSVKRAIDVAGAILGAAVFVVPVLIAAALVRITMGRPVLFRQVRPGLHGRPFVIWKLRTMRETTDEANDPLAREARLTRLGRWLRTSSLDELPELLNVLRGEMSLVGPRPLRVEYLALYTPHQARRHEVRPGITGWALIHGRNALSWEEKFDLDVWYVDHRSVWLDLWILVVTVWKVLRCEGVTARGDKMMPWFTGTGSGASGGD
jgi:sugar transferase EpsL